MIAYKEWFGFKTEPRAHQREALRKAATKPAFAYLMDPGTGKTWDILLDAAYLHFLGHIDTLVVLAPNGVHRQWILEQVPEHFPDWIVKSAAYYRRGKPGREVQDVRADKQAFRIITINIEAISREAGEDFVRHILKTSKAMLVVDESQRIKNGRSTRAKAAIRLSKFALYRRIASGTPISQGYEDLYAQFKFLDPAIIGCATFAEFRRMFCRTWGSFNAIVGYKNIAQLMQRIAPYCYIKRLEDCVDLPKMNPLVKLVDISPEQKRLYNELRDEYLTELDNGMVLEAPLVITRIKCLQQILAGHTPGATPDEYEPIKGPIPRLEACADVLEDAPGKAIMWSRFIPDLIRMGEELTERKIPYVEYSGRYKPEVCDAAVDAFQHDPKVKVLLATERKGGVGLNLQCASTVAFYSSSYSYQDWDQALHRILRMGQLNVTNMWDFRVKGSVDDRILEVRSIKHKRAVDFKDPAVFRRWLETEPEEM